RTRSRSTAMTTAESAYSSASTTTTEPGPVAEGRIGTTQSGVGISGATDRPVSSDAARSATSASGPMVVPLITSFTLAVARTPSPPGAGARYGGSATATASDSVATGPRSL